MKVDNQAHSHLHSLSHDERLIAMELARCRSGAAGYEHWIENHCMIEDEKDATELLIADAGGLRAAQRMSFSLSWHQRHIWKCPERTLTPLLSFELDLLHHLELMDCALAV